MSTSSVTEPTRIANENIGVHFVAVGVKASDGNNSVHHESREHGRSGDVVSSALCGIS